MEIEKFDLNLLRIFDAIYAEQSVTRAAAKVGLTQSSVSNALARIRRHCNDPLFVRVQGNMEPTPCAERLAKSIRRALSTLESAFAEAGGFDAATSSRIFTIMMSDFAAAIILPQLAERLASQAPDIQVVMRQSARSDYKALLESGEADIAVGHLNSELQSGFYQKRLFSDSFSCVLGGKFRLPHDGRFDLDAYLAARHVVASASRTEMLLEKELGRLNLKRHVALRVPQFLILAPLLRHSDLVVTVPDGLAKLLKRQGAFRVERVPFKIPQTQFLQVWHARFHDDSGNRWLRNMLASLDYSDIGK